MTRQSLPSASLGKALQSPFFRSLHDEIDRAFGRFGLGVPFENLGTTGDLMPALNIAETDDTLEITAEIPGVKESDLDISISGQSIILKGEKSNEAETKEKDYHLVERQYGSFRRQVPLGFTPAADSVTARFSDGVLELKIKKPAETVAGTQKIKISSK